MPRRAYSSAKSSYLRASGSSARHGILRSSSMRRSCEPVSPHHGDLSGALMPKTSAAELHRIT